MFKCNEHGYGLENKCKICAKEAKEIKVPKFSPEDVKKRYANDVDN